MLIDPWVVNAQIGIVSHAHEMGPVGLFSDGTHIASANANVLGAFDERRGSLREPPFEVIGSGAGGTGESARFKALMEALERFAAATVLDSEIVTGALAALPFRPMPGLHHYEGAYSSAGHGRTPYDAGRRWVLGYHLNTQTEVMLPLEIAHVPLRDSVRDGVFPQSTSGVAAAFSLEEAVVAAIYELVERDAVELVWRLRVPLPQIDADDLPACDLARLIHHDAFLEAVDQEYFDATTDIGIPIVYGVRTLRLPIGNDVIVTCAAHHDLATAMIKVRRDAGALQAARTHAAWGKPYSRWPAGVGMTGPQLSAELSFLKARGARISLPRGDEAGGGTGTNRLRAVLDVLFEQGRDVIVSNLTTDELRHLGVEVVRVVVPSLLPMCPEDGSRFEAHARYADAVRHFGLTPDDKSARNAAPQPFR